MAFPATEEGWKKRAADFLKEELQASGATYELLAHLLKCRGFDETVASISNKLKRGTFSAAWLLACLSVNGGLDVSFRGVETLRFNGKVPHHRKRKNLFTLKDYLKDDKSQDDD